MKKNVKTLALFTLATGLLLGLGSCQGESADGSGSGSGTSTLTVKKIGHDTLPYLQLGKSLDLDEYIYASLEDGSKSSDYEVTCSSKEVTLTGHAVTASKVGQYTLVVTAGAKTSKITLDVRSKKQIEIIDFLKPLETTPQNYTVSLYSGSTGYWTLYHTPNYVVSAVYGAIENKESLSAKRLTDDFGDGDEVEPGETFYNMIIARLANSKGYFGYVDQNEDEDGNVTSYFPTFEPGYVSYDNYYMTMDLSLDGADVNYEESGDLAGELVSTTGFETNLLNYGLSQFPNYYADDDGNAYQYAGAVLDGLYDYDDDGVYDELVFQCLVSAGDTLGSWCSVGISNIGTTSLDFMTDVATNSDYVPTPIDSSEIATAYSNLASGKNYTVTWTMESTDSSYEPTSDDDYLGEDADACGWLFGGKKAVATELFTEDGTVGLFTVDGENLSAVAYWDDGTDSYSSAYDSETSGMPAPTKSEGVSDVYSSGLFAYASSVTATGLSTTNWTGKTTDETTGIVTFEGDVGDNDGEEASNALFQQLVSQSLFFSGYADSFTEAQTFSSSSGATSVHALTCYSDYGAIVVNPSTNEVSVEIDMYVPIGLDNPTMTMKIEISEIGTTSFDFSTLTNGIDGFPTLTSSIGSEDA